LRGLACGAAFLAGIGLVSVAAPADAPNIRGDATGPTTSPSEVIKGGSYLCASNLLRAIPGIGRQPREVDLSTGHVGFRTVVNGPGP
jgi:hypothetical protein